MKQTLAAVLLCLTTSLSAGTISPGTWYEFGFDQSGSFATDGTGSAGVPGTSVADAPPWTFKGQGTFTLTDAFTQGDSFSLFDNGRFIGSTPHVAPGFVNVEDPNLTSVDPTFSHEIFTLGPGSHSLTIRTDDSPFGGGSAFFRLAVVPEPKSAVLSGILLLGAFGYLKTRRQ